MKSKSKVVAILLVVVIFLTSCTTLAKKALPYFQFQGMAEPGVIVVSVDALSEKDLVASAFVGLDEFARRASRVSLALSPKSTAYPLETADLGVWGVVDGDYPRFLLNTGMMYARELSQKASETGLSWFSQKKGPISLYTPKNDQLLFTNGSYEDAYGKYSQKRLLLGNDMAAMMANASIAVYAREPETFFDLGLDLPETVITQAKEMVLLINQAEGKYTLDAYITMDTPKLANTLSQMVRSGYLARLKKDKIPFKIADLMKQFMIENDLVTIKNMELSDEQMQTLRQGLTGVL